MNETLEINSPTTPSRDHDDDISLKKKMDLVDVSPVGVDELGAIIPKQKGLLKRDSSSSQPGALAQLYENDKDDVFEGGEITQQIKKDNHQRRSRTTREIESDDDDESSEGEDIETHRSRANLWSEEMDALINSRTLFEAVSCLRRVTFVLDDVDEEDRFNYCKTDFEQSIQILREEEYNWWDDACHDIISIMLTYFDQSFTRKIPSILTQEIFLWLPVEDIFTASEVCCEWNELVNEELVWEKLYRRKFLQHNPKSWPSEGLLMNFTFRSLYQLRLRTPMVGDRVEVAWRGKFRLEAQEVYQGLAWWVAQVVDSHEEQDRYKIRYLGWDSHWDDWIPRNRLRWAVMANPLDRIRQHDHVELWCIGSNVPGAWLETRIRKIRGSRYYLDDQVLTNTGPMWVRRDRLRLVKRGGNSGKETEDEEDIDETPVVEQRNSQRLSFSGLASIGRVLTATFRRRASEDAGTATSLLTGTDIQNDDNDNNNDNNNQRSNRRNSNRRRHSGDGASMMTNNANGTNNTGNGNRPRLGSAPASASSELVGPSAASSSSITTIVSESTTVVPARQRSWRSFRNVPVLTRGDSDNITDAVNSNNNSSSNGNGNGRRSRSGSAASNVSNDGNDDTDLMIDSRLPRRNNSWRSNERRGSRNQMGSETERSTSRRRASENNANIMVSQSQREGQRAVVPMATARQNSAPSLGRNRQGSRRESCSIM